jgi:integral membrane sensor domain MASE1
LSKAHGVLTCRPCAALLQGALPTPEEVAQRKQLAAACVHTLLLMISNVLADPGDEKKRTVRTVSAHVLC